MLFRSVYVARPLNPIYPPIPVPVMRTVDRVAIDVAAHELPGFLSCLRAIVVYSAQGLPIVAVPEQHLIPLMWGDVVNHCGGDDLPLLLAVPTEWILCEERYPGLTPLVVIPTLVCSTTIFHAAT